MEPVSVLVAQAEMTDDEHYKFYHVYITENVGLVTWGRIGTAGQHQWVTPEEANHRWEAKLRKGYHQVDSYATVVYPGDPVSDPDLAEVVQQHFSGDFIAASRRTAAWTQDAALSALQDVRDALDAAGLGRPDNGLNGAEMTGLTEAVGSVGFAISPNRARINAWDSGPYLQWNIVIDGITAGVQYEDEVVFDGTEGHSPVDADKLIPQIESIFRSLGWNVVEVHKTGHQLVWDHDIDFSVLTEDPERTARRTMRQRRVAGTYDDWSFEELVDDWFGGLNKAMRKVRELLQEEDPQAAQDLDDSYDVVEDYFGREMLIEWLEEDDGEFSRGAAIDVPEINGTFTAWDGTEVPISVTEDGTVLCAWFAGCTNPATDVAEHPVLCEVPACAEHYEFAKGASTRRAVVTGWTQEDGPIYSFNEQVWAQRYIGNDEPFSLAVDTDTGTMLFLGIVHDEEVDVNVDEFAYGDSIPLGEPLLDWITANVLTRDSIRGNTTWVAPIKGYGS